MMGTYFKPLRRKIGVLTLVMACVLTAGWVGSRTYADVIRFRIWNATNIITSANCELRWDYYNNRPDLWMIRGAIDRRRTPLNTPYGLDPMMAGIEKTEFNCGVMSVGFGKTLQRNGDDVQFVSCRSKYWFLLNSLTLISTWLLLSKPKQQKRSIEQ